MVQRCAGPLRPAEREELRTCGVAVSLVEARSMEGREEAGHDLGAIVRQSVRGSGYAMRGPCLRLTWPFGGRAGA